jgi:hypothetical protein
MCRGIVTAFFVAVLAIVALSPAPSHAQGQLPQPPVGFKPPPPPPPAPVKPFTPVAITPAGPFNDPSFAAFRKNVAEAAAHKDRAALSKLIVAQGFFWVQDKNLADATKPGIDNLAKALGLNDPDTGGWDILTSDANDPTLAEVPQQPGLYCAPAPPKFDVSAFQNMVEQTDTDPTDWGYPSGQDVAVRAAAQPNAQVVEKLGLYFVRVLADSAPAQPGAPMFLHVALPDGKTGYVAVDDVVPLASDQICYTKQAGAWKIAGYIGGVSP